MINIYFLNLQSNILNINSMFTSLVSEVSFLAKKEIELLHKVFHSDVRICDVLMHLPYRYGYVSKVDKIYEIPENADVRMRVRILSHKGNTRYKKAPFKIESMMISNGKILNMVFFNFKPWQASVFAVGKEVVIEGKLKNINPDLYQMAHPKISDKDVKGFECISKGAKINKQEDIIAENSAMNDNALGVKSFTPYYYLPSSVRPLKYYDIIKKIIDKINEHDLGVQHCDLLAKNNYIDLNTALSTIHIPQSIEDTKSNSKGLLRLSFDEMLAQSIASDISNSNMNGEGLSINGDDVLIKKVLSSLPFSLTQDQEAVIKEIKDSQKSNRKMFRLLQGDVGSGKTIVALLSIINCIQCKKLGIIIAPTTVLAGQHFKSFQKTLKDFDISIALLTGKTKVSDRRKIERDIANKDLDILVSTHAVMYSNFDLSNTGIFVIDEQHKFGVKQRSELAVKSPRSDILLMTATPIPRTLSMILYGKVEWSKINSKPKNRKDIKTVVMSDKSYDEVVSSIKSKITEGERVYWVCPALDENDEISSVEERFKEITKVIDPKEAVLLHGLMKETEKDSIIEKFASGEKRLLISTSVIEVGIDVPEANYMVIEQAERFGLSQLHQIRGRVGRSDQQGYCILMYRNVNSFISKKLQTFKENLDGFKISEYDKKFRGSGEVVGTKQSGFGSLKLSHVDHGEADLAYLIAESKSSNDEKSKNIILDFFNLRNAAENFSNN